jgi:hypothetical protein
MRNGSQVLLTWRHRERQQLNHSHDWRRHRERTNNNNIEVEPTTDNNNQQPDVLWRNSRTTTALFDDPTAYGFVPGWAVRPVGTWRVGPCCQPTWRMLGRGRPQCVMCLLTRRTAGPYVWLKRKSRRDVHTTEPWYVCVKHVAHEQVTDELPRSERRGGHCVLIPVLGRW